MNFLTNLCMQIFLTQNHVSNSSHKVNLKPSIVLIPSVEQHTARQDSGLSIWDAKNILRNTNDAALTLFFRSVKFLGLVIISGLGRNARRPWEGKCTLAINYKSELSAVWSSTVNSYLDSRQQATSIPLINFDLYGYV